jgi:hypothetical protein
MQTITQLLKRYPATVAFYLLYSLLCFRIGFMSASDFKREHHLDGGLPYVFTIFLATVFIVVNIINVAFHKEDKSFYLWLSLIILIQTFIAVAIG